MGGPAAAPMSLHGAYVIGPVAVDDKTEPTIVAHGGWVASPATVTNQALRNVRTQDDRLRLTVDSGQQAGVVYLTTAGIPPKRAVLVGPDVTDLGATGGNGAAVSDTGGHPPVRRALTSASIPFLGTDGVLIDNTMMTHNRQVYDNTWTTYILAAGDTPHRLANQLATRGLHVETTHAAVRHRLDATAYALAMRLYGLAAVASLLLALAGLAVSTAVQAARAAPGCGLATRGRGAGADTGQRDGAGARNRSRGRRSRGPRHGLGRPVVGAAHHHPRHRRSSRRPTTRRGDRPIG